MAGRPKIRARREALRLAVASRENPLHPAGCSCRRCAGMPVVHGASSERQIRRRAAAHKRRFLRQTGLRQSDLESVGRALLQNWARNAAALGLLDDYMAEHGLLDEAGNPRGFASLYARLLNSERAALRALESYIRRQEDDGGDGVARLYEGLRDG
jgi:hypothetical protein